MAETNKDACPLFQFQIGTWGSLNGDADVGDTFAAHEVLPNAYLRAIGANPSGARLPDNPAIALGTDIHAQINQMQLDWGIKNPEFLKTLTPEQVIEANYNFMIKAGVPQDNAIEVSKNALNYTFANGIECP